MASDFHELAHPSESGGEARFNGRWTRLDGIAGVVALVRTLGWRWKFAIGAAVSLPWAAARILAFGVSPDYPPYVAFYPGVAIAAALGGWIPGLGAVLISVLAGALWFPPAPTVDFALRFSSFVVYAAAICAFGEALHRALLRLGEAEGRRKDAETLLIASERFRLASGGDIGTFDLDLVNNMAGDTDAMRAIFGIPSGAVVNTERVLGLALPEDRPKIEKGLAAAYDPAGEGVYEAEYRIHRESDGALRWIAARGQVYFRAGRPIRMIGVCRDITDVRTAQQAVQNSEAQIRRFVEHAPTEVAMFDRDMTYVAASARWLANYGKGLESLIGVNHYALHPDIPDRWKAVHQRVKAGEFHTDDSDVWIDGEGRVRWLRWAVFPWTDSSGAIGGVIMSAEDISAQKEAEAALHESEEKFRNAFAGAAIGFVMAKAGCAIVEANEAYCRLTGYTAAELRTMQIVDLAHPEDRAGISAMAGQVLRGDIPAWVSEHRCLRKDGGLIWVRESLSMTRDAAGDPRWVVNLIEDVTERRRMSDTAARTVAQLTAVLDGARDAIISIDLKGVVLSINAAGERMFGYDRDEVIGRSVGVLMPQPDARQHNGYIANYLETGIGRIIGIGREAEGRRKDGTIFPIELAISEAAVYNDLMFVGFVRDLSERRRIESRIDQLAAQRLTAIGGMAGALAHELNQPLAAMGVYLETARRMLLKPPDQRAQPVEEAIGRALAQVGRMGDIIGHLRDFVGHGEPDKTFQSLHGLIERVSAESIPGGKGREAALSLDLTAERDVVVMDPVQIGLVLSNLIRNAREAVGNAPDGRIVVSTALDADDMIRCEVSDNGPGLDDSIKENLFEPLTSTKAQGMGVGLSISKSIIEAHYGLIWAQANPGSGATFGFTLPLAGPEGDE